MASLLRQIVAGPRSRHPEAGLDLCYVTDKIIATSGPSGTYPQRAYRNPLDELVKWLDSKHEENWAIWEFRAEGTGYPDSEVYNRIYHYPFPDHHPPPFALMPNIMASMRNWLKGKDDRVVVVHCKAGKGRSGTASCAYLIAEEGWPVEKALNRFTERRMRPGMGKGVSIPSQLRWIGYVDRWAKHGKIYVERQVEVLEVHCWGLRHGVKIRIEGFIEDGKKIKTFHTFTRSEREVVRGEIDQTGGLASVVSEVMERRAHNKKEHAKRASSADGSTQSTANSSTTSFDQTRAAVDGASNSTEEFDDRKGGDVVFRPSKRVVLPTNDLNIDVERRNNTAFDLTYVTAVAHVWFNVFFEGKGPEQGGIADDSGVFEISWDAMDGIKGSSRKGIPAFDKMAVVWQTIKPEGKPGIVITEPGEDEEVPQYSPADWKGEGQVEPSEGKDLGIRTASPATSTTDVSKASSVDSGDQESGSKKILTAPDPAEDSTEGVRPHGPNGEENINYPGSELGTATTSEGAQLNGPAEQPRNNTTPQEEAQPPSNNSASGIISVATGDLPDGKPENEMKDSKEHHILHMGKNWTSS